MLFFTDIGTQERNLMCLEEKPQYQEQHQSLLCLEHLHCNSKQPRRAGFWWEAIAGDVTDPKDGMPSSWKILLLKLMGVDFLNPLEDVGAWVSGPGMGTAVSWEHWEQLVRAQRRVLHFPSWVQFRTWLRYSSCSFLSWPSSTRVLLSQQSSSKGRSVQAQH